MLRDENGVRVGGIGTEHAVAGLVLGCLIALILIRRGFRGISIPGVGGASVGS